MSLWDDITAWLYLPFQEPLDPFNFIMLIIFSATIAFIWSRILEHVLEE